jgi:hypothetical protein
MMVLLGVDPDISKSSTLAIGIEDEYGKPVPPEQMLTLGTDHVLGLADLKTPCDALGSYLHMPSLSQIQAGKIADCCKTRIFSIGQYRRRIARALHEGDWIALTRRRLWPHVET